jgi:hypothetical protein
MKIDLRDYFAIHCPEQVKNITWNDVRKGLGLAHDLDIKHWTDNMTLLYKTKKRYEYADAMLKARELNNDKH